MVEYWSELHRVVKSTGPLYERDQSEFARVLQDQLGTNVVTNILVIALEAGIATRLTGRVGHQAGFLLQPLVDRLTIGAGLRENVAHWAVDTWALALEITAMPNWPTAMPIESAPTTDLSALVLADGQIDAEISLVPHPAIGSKYPEQLVLSIFRRLLAESDPAAYTVYTNFRPMIESAPDYLDSWQQRLNLILDEMSRPKLEAIGRLIALGNDEEIAALGDERLITYMRNTLSPLLERVSLARERTIALRLLRRALLSNDGISLSDIYKRDLHLLLPCRNFKYEERRAVIDLVRTTAQHQFEDALTSNDPQSIAQTGERALAAGYQIPAAEMTVYLQARRVVAALTRLQHAIERDDEFAISFAYSPELQHAPHLLTPAMRARIQLADERITRYHSISKALTRADAKGVAASYDPAIMAGSALLTPEEHENCRRLCRRASDLETIREAFDSRDADRIREVTVRIPDLPEAATPYDHYLSRLAKDRIIACDELTEALASYDPQAIALKYQYAVSIGAQVKLSPEDLHRVLSAQLAAETIAQLDDISTHDDRMTLERRFRTSTLDGSPDEESNLGKASRRLGALLRLRRALRTGDDCLVKYAYQPNLVPQSALTSEELQRLTSALSASNEVGPTTRVARYEPIMKPLEEKSLEHS